MVVGMTRKRNWPGPGKSPLRKGLEYLYGRGKTEYQLHREGFQDPYTGRRFLTFESLQKFQKGREARKELKIQRQRIEFEKRQTREAEKAIKRARKQARTLNRVLEA